jgi:hypothetical protein
MGARSYSSFSLYANFAGESLDDEDEDGHHHRRRVAGGAQGSRINEEEKLDEEDQAAQVEEPRKAPTASVGKAMFMFLKAFLGSGVLFLPKA